MERNALIDDAIAVYEAAIAAVRPERMIDTAPLEQWLGRPLAEYAAVRVVGAGKGALAMAAALGKRLGARIDEGAVVAPHGYGRPGFPSRPGSPSRPVSMNPAFPSPDAPQTDSRFVLPGSSNPACFSSRIEILGASHPIPDAAGVAATARILQIAGACGPDDLLVALISGGGSALLAGYAAGISLDDAQSATNLLLRCGATIHEINAVRKHVSRIHGGRLAEAAARNGAEILGLVVSDVIGDDLSVISSGPTVADPSSFADALRAIEKYDLRRKLPVAVRSHLERGLAESNQGNAALETPKPGSAIFARVRNELIGDNRMALEGAAAEARRRGHAVEIAARPLQGEARDAGKMIAGATLQSEAGVCLLWGGETTVTVRGDGHGGRNQELVLAAAIALDAAREAGGAVGSVVVLGGGTDGVDGISPPGFEPAAGAWATAETCAAARETGLDPHAHLMNNDAYPFFAALDALLLPGPTHTNVMDVQICLVERAT